MTYLDDITNNGFAIFEGSLDPDILESVHRELKQVGIDRMGSQRAGKAFALRNLMNAVPATRELANSSSLKSLVEPILGPTGQVVRAIYFDKHRDANWKVSWHQDLTIAVRTKQEVEGFQAWSIKAGVTHVQPPVSVLESMLTLRVQLDNADASNGALRVLPGTHRYGRLDGSQIQYWKQRRDIVTCAVKRGGILVMRPLLLHSSLASLNPVHRRVLHFEYASLDLPCKLAWYEDR